MSWALMHSLSGALGQQQASLRSSYIYVVSTASCMLAMPTLATVNAYAVLWSETACIVKQAAKASLLPPT